MFSFLRKYRRSIIVLGVFAATGVLLVSVAPVAIRYGVIAWLEGNDERRASIADVDFNPFTGRMSIADLEVTEPGGRTLGAARLALDIALSQLWERRLHARSLEIRDGRVEIERRPDGSFRVAGLPRRATSAEPAAAGDWQLGADSISVDGVRVRFHAAGASETVTLQRVRIADLATWRPAEATRIDADLSLGTGSLHVAGEARPFAAVPSLDATASAASVDLARAAKLVSLPALTGLSGTASSALAAKVQFSRAGKLTLSLRGSVSLGKAAAAVVGGDSAGFAFDRARVDGLDASVSLGPGAARQIVVAASARLDGLDLHAGALALRQEHARWNGRIEASAANGGPAMVRVVGDLDGEDGTLRATGRAVAPSPSVAVGRLVLRKLDGRIELAPAGVFKAKVSAAVELGGIDGRFHDGTFSNGTVRWDGRLELDGGASPRQTLLVVGKLASEKLALALPGAGLSLSQDAAHWEGAAEFQRGASPDQDILTMTAAARTSGTRVDSAELGMRLIDLGSLALEGITIKGYDRVSIGRLRAQAMRTVEPLDGEDAKSVRPGQYVAAVGSLTASDLRVLDRSRISAETVALDGADVRVERLADGELRLVGSLLGMAGRLSAVQDDAAEGPPPAFRVKRWIVSGGSRLSFTDRTVKPVAKFAIAPLDIRISDIDSAKPRTGSPIALSAKLGKYSMLDLKGTFKPFSDRLTLDVSGRLNGFELTDLSGYASRHLGYGLARGRLDADLRAIITDGRLRAESKLTISKLKLEPADPRLLEAVEKRIEVPLETALPLLRDSEDVIRLTIPVTGDIDSPNFDFSDAVNQAIGNAMKNTILATVKIAFPLGGVIMTMVEAGGKARLRIDPVGFAAGDAGLTPDAHSHLDRVADLLLARPGVKISVCGWSTASDRAVLLAKAAAARKAAAERSTASGQPGAATPDRPIPIGEETLLALAKRRGEAVKDDLIRRPGIGESRIFLCAPKLSKEADATPRSEIFL